MRSYLGTRSIDAALFRCSKLWRRVVATIEVQPDKVQNDVWWLYCTELDEIVARINRDSNGCCEVVPQGPTWGPMKSIGRIFDSPEHALREVRLYFERR